jgi:hypothetical protein
MANSALIEDLRKQFAENPRRVFARLANEYRKSGDLNVAIEICRAHVPLQPTYISGYIVLGQALFESGQPEEARATFETALSLDPENLIALRQLGDIARASGDLDGARGWYHKLLEVDPQNEEAALQLEALDAPQANLAPAPAATTATKTPAEVAPVSWSDIHPDSQAVTPLSTQAMQPTRPRFTIGVIPENLAADQESAAPAASAPAAPAPVVKAPDAIVEQGAVSTTLPEFFGGFDRHSPTPPAASPVVPEPLAAEAPVEAEHDGANVESLELMDISDLAPEAEDELHADLPPIATTSEFAIPESEPIAAVSAPEPAAAASAPEASAPAVPPATAAELATLFAGPELETPKHEPPAAASSADASNEKFKDGRTFEEEPYDPTIGRMLDLSNKTSSDALLPDLMMTESGAELLREQGHIDQAIYVYRHLAAKNPDDTSYAERIAALERGAHSSIPLIASISQDVIYAAKNREYSTQSIRTFFTSFATRKPPGDESVDDASAPAASAPAASAAAPAHAAQAPEAHEWHAPEAVEAPATSMDPWSAASLEHTTSFAVPAEARMPAAKASDVKTPEAKHATAPPETVSDADRSALETLFSGTPKVAANDERAATALASAFSEEYSSESTGPAGQPTRAASDALSLDTVFQNTRTRADGDARPGQPTVSFDQFFANRENGNASDNKSDAAVETASLGDDSQSDLELFHEWLDGLKK